jgi:AmmeMemoRadiSam system protein B
MSRLPRARVDIKLVPGELEGRQVLRVEDGVVARDQALTLELETFQQLFLFDGEQTLEDLRQTLCEQRGDEQSSANAEQVVRELDAMLLLQTPRYHTRLAEVRRSYAALSTRTATLAGTAYPGQPAALRALLDRVLAADETPGRTAPTKTLRAIVAPHVDLDDGCRAYAAAYGALQRAALQPDRLILLGTGHTLEHALLSCTAKDYQTPLGLLPTDRTAVRALHQAAGALAEADDFAHRDEHALELQAIFLQHLLPQPVPTIPFLVGPVDDWLSRVDRLAEIPGADQLLQALAAQVTPRTLLVASVDLCHVGHRYGDERTAQEQEADVAEHEARLLDALVQGSAAALWAEARRVDDRYRVCGLSSLALALELLERVDGTPRGEVLERVILRDDPTASAVSIAAAAVYR